MDMATVSGLSGGRAPRLRVGRGRGSGLGKTSGRGHKGARARSGWKRRWFAEGGQMPLYRRLPKKGFSNARFKIRYDVVNVGDLAALEAGTRVDLALLEQKGMVTPRYGKLKVLGDGDLEVALEVTAAMFSEAARRKIEGAGGKAQQVE